MYSSAQRQERLSPLNVSQADGWLRQFDARPDADLRLFCFPYAGSGPSIYRDWVDLLPDNVEMAAVNYPGRELQVSAKPRRDLESIVDDLCAHIVPFLDKPFAFFGHSMGAYVSFRLTTQLHSRFGLRPEGLFLSAAGAPHIPEPNPIHELAPKDFLRALIRLNGFPPEVRKSPELIQYALPILRADFAACERFVYELGDQIPTPLYVFGGRSDPRVDEARLEAWRHHAGVSFSLRMFDGDHFYLRPQGASLVGDVVEHLKRLADI